MLTLSTATGYANPTALHKTDTRDNTKEQDTRASNTTRLDAAWLPPLVSIPHNGVLLVAALCIGSPLFAIGSCSQSQSRHLVFTTSEMLQLILRYRDRAKVIGLPPPEQYSHRVACQLPTCEQPWPAANINVVGPTKLNPFRSTLVARSPPSWATAPALFSFSPSSCAPLVAFTRAQTFLVLPALDLLPDTASASPSFGPPRPFGLIFRCRWLVTFIPHYTHTTSTGASTSNPLAGQSWLATCQPA